MQYLEYIFSSFWIFCGVVILLLIATDSMKRVLKKVSNEFDKLVERYKARKKDE